MALNFANNNSLSAISAKPSGLSGGALNLISTQTASGSSTISFASGIDSTYDEYVIKLINCHPSSSASFMFNMSIDSGSNYNVTKTTTYFRAYHQENGGGGVLAYDTGFDLAQSTAFQDLTADSVSTDSDHGVSGSIHLFNPSSTTFVKHFIANINSIKGGSSSEMKNSYSAGYGNTTSAVNAVQFKFDSGTIQSGVIKLYGVS